MALLPVCIFSSQLNKKPLMQEVENLSHRHNVWLILQIIKFHLHFPIALTCLVFIQYQLKDVFPAFIYKSLQQALKNLVKK